MEPAICYSPLDTDEGDRTDRHCERQTDDYSLDKETEVHAAPDNFSKRFSRKDILRYIRQPFFIGRKPSRIIEVLFLSLIHISEPTRRTPISYAVFCLKKK